MRIWTAEARAKQSALMKRLKPWTKSTGPKTPEGKAKAAKNSYKTGLHAKPMKQVRKYFRDCKEFIKFLKTEYYKLDTIGQNFVASDNYMSFEEHSHIGCKPYYST